MILPKGRRNRLSLARLVSLALFAGLLSGCADSILLHPSRDPFVPAGAQSRIIQTPTSSIEIWTRRADPSRAPDFYVLEFCGNATRAEYVINESAQRWRTFNAEIWAVNYAGFGASSGRATVRSIAPTALAAYDALREIAGDHRIFVTGRSIGTTAALYVAANRPVAGLLLHSPTPLRSVILGSFGWWNLWIAAGIIAAQVPADLDSLANGRHVHVPAVMIISEQDALVAARHQRRLADAYGGPRKLLSLSHAGHKTQPTAEEAREIERAIRWLVDSPREPISRRSPP